jgi:hypothetical protein
MAPRIETITIPASCTGTYGGALDYATVTSTVPSAMFMAAVIVGTIGTGAGSALNVGSSRWIRVDDYGFAAAQIAVEGSGTITFTVEGSSDDPKLRRSSDVASARHHLRQRCRVGAQVGCPTRG